MSGSCDQRKVVIMKIININIKRMIGENVKGRAIISKETICFRSEYNPITGIVGNTHSLRGKTLKEKILIIPSTKGSSGNTMYIRLMVMEGNAPIALICLNIDPLVALGCIVNKIPLILIDKKEIFEIVKENDYIEINGEKRILSIQK